MIGVFTVYTVNRSLLRAVFAVEEIFSHVNAGDFGAHGISQEFIQTQFPVISGGIAACGRKLDQHCAVLTAEVNPAILGVVGTHEPT